MTESQISIAEVAQVESTFQPGKVPEEVWLEHLRLHAITTLEFTPWKIENGKIKVYMTRRSASDPVYPNMLHSPGTMANGNDASLEDVINRLKEKEMSDFLVHEPEQARSFIRKTTRGTEGVMQFLIQVIDGGDPENWYEAENLPLDTINHHKEMTQYAVGIIKAKGTKRQTVAFE